MNRSVYSCWTESALTQTNSSREPFSTYFLFSANAPFQFLSESPPTNKPKQPPRVGRKGFRWKRIKERISGHILSVRSFFNFPLSFFYILSKVFSLYRAFSNTVTTRRGLIINLAPWLLNQQAFNRSYLCSRWSFTCSRCAWAKFSCNWIFRFNLSATLNQGSALSTFICKTSTSAFDFWFHLVLM